MDVADSELVSRHRRGDEEAFSILYERHADGLYRYARSLCRDRALAEDLVQEAFVRLIQLDEGRLSGSIRVFLFTVLRNLLRDELRRVRTRRENRPLAAQPVPANAPEEEREQHRRLEQALARLDALPDDQREVVVLRLHGELTFAEIGTLLGAPTQTIASRYRYALERIARELSEEKP